MALLILNFFTEFLIWEKYWKIVQVQFMADSLQKFWSGTVFLRLPFKGTLMQIWKSPYIF